MKYSDFKYTRAVRNKYGTKRVELDGHVFDSDLEARRYQELKILQRAGKIGNLQLQVPFELIPTQRDENGILLESKCSYVADFVYIDENGKKVVEDAKGMDLPVWVIKRKLMLWRHGIRVKVIR